MKENVRNFVSSIETALARSAAPFLVCLCPMSPRFEKDAERATFLRQMEEMIASSLERANSVHVVRSAETESLYPVDEYYDTHSDRLGRVPYTSKFFAALGTVIARKIHAMRTAPYKVIVLDCDQTLWKGICGEDGPAGVVIDPPRRQLQQFMVKQRDAGMLLAMASKNNEEDVLETFAAHPEMPLNLDHFTSWRINWGFKSANLRQLASELQLGLDSFILLDDSPTECAEVQANCPEVLTLQLPSEPGLIPKFLNHVWAFDHLSATEEDKKRAAMYGQRLERRKLQRQVGTLQEFLEALDLEIEIGEMTPQQLPRVSQLTHRTNQMNLTTIRRSESEIQKLLSAGKLECLTVDVKDRLGSYGLVGVVLFSASADELETDTFLLSCRALGRGVEQRILAHLGSIATERGLQNVKVRYVRTAKNQPALDFLQSLESQYAEKTENGFIYRFPASYAAGVSYNPESLPGEPLTEKAVPKPAGTVAHSVDYGHIAADLDDAQKVLEKVRDGGHSDAASTVPYKSPPNSLGTRTGRDLGRDAKG